MRRIFRWLSLLVLLGGLAPAAMAVTIVASGTYPAGDYQLESGSFSLSPGTYSAKLSTTTPVTGLFGSVDKLTITSYWCQDGPSDPVYYCGGDDVPTFFDFVQANSLSYLAKIVINPPTSVFIPGGPVIGYDDFDICCTYSFGFDAPAAGSFSLAFTTVPEPQTWLLLALGTGAVGLRLRRRRFRAAMGRIGIRPA